MEEIDRKAKELKAKQMSDQVEKARSSSLGKSLPKD
jgi:hypothetical protein